MFALTGTEGETQLLSFAPAEPAPSRRAVSLFGQSTSILQNTSGKNTNISLFGADANQQTNTPVVEALPQRTTTYEGKQLPAPPLLRGTSYIQDPNDLARNLSGLNLNAMPLPELYAYGYGATMMQRRREQAASFPSIRPPPDSDSDGTNINMEHVIGYTHDIAAAFNTCEHALEPPSPFEVLHQIITVMAQHVPVLPGERSVLGSHSGPSDESRKASLPSVSSSSGPLSFLDAAATLFNPADAPNCSVSNSGMSIVSALLDSRTPTTVLLNIERMIDKDPHLAKRLPHNSVCLLLDCIHSSVHNSRLVRVISRIILNRKELREVLQLVDALERGLASEPPADQPPLSPLSPVMFTEAKDCEDDLSSFALEACLYTLGPFSRIGVTPLLDAHFEEPVQVSLGFDEMQVSRFCVSCDGQFIVIATPQGLLLRAVDSGVVLARCSEVTGNCWSLHFNPLETELLYSDSSGKSHVLVGCDVAGCRLEVIRRITQDEPSMGFFAQDGTLSFLQPPALPSGRFESSLMLLGTEKAVLPLGTLPPTLSGQPQTKPSVFVTQLNVAAMLSTDFCGQIALFEADQESLEITVKPEELLVLTHKSGGVSSSCQARFPRKGPATWTFLCVTWAGGVWSAIRDSELCQLGGTRAIQSRGMQLSSATMLTGTGHVAGIAAWSGALKREQLHLLATENVLHTPSPLFHMPMDEGSGPWLKEKVGHACITLQQTGCVWDLECPAPYSLQKVLPARSSSFVFSSNDDAHPCRIPTAVFLQSHILRTDFQTVLLSPPAAKGGDEVAIRLDPTCRRVAAVASVNHPAVYQPDAIPFVLRDESRMLTFVARFSKLSSVKINSPEARRAAAAVAQVPEETPTVPRGAHCRDLRKFLDELYITLYSESFQFLRCPRATTPITPEGLEQVSQSLSQFQTGKNQRRTLALLALGIVHFRALSETPELVMNAATTLNAVCQRILQDFDQSLLYATAMELFRVGVSRALTPQHKAEILCHADEPRNADIVANYMCRETLVPLAAFLVHENSELLLKVLDGLLRCSVVDLRGEFPAQPPPASQLVWFVVSVVVNCQSEQFAATLRLVFFRIVSFSENLIISLNWSDSLQATAVQTALVPLLVLLADRCPFAITHEMQDRLLQLLENVPSPTNDDLADEAHERINRLPLPLSPSPPSAVSSAAEPRRDKHVISFTVRNAVDIVPTLQTWRIALDYSGASVVFINKDTNTNDIRVLRPESGTSVMLMTGTTGVRLDGGQLLLHGTGAASFTVQCQYELLVRTSYSRLLAESVWHCLAKLSRHLLAKPPACDFLLAPLMRGGLSTATLRDLKHPFCVERPPTDMSLAKDILEHRGEGQRIADDVFRSMRGSVTPSMMPAVQALLAVLVLVGYSPKEAEDELKVRWFSGDWGSKLQGERRDEHRQQIIALATWLITAIHVPQAVVAATRRLSLSDRRSFSDRKSFPNEPSKRTSASSVRRSTTRSLNAGVDALEHIRSLFTKGVTPAQLEEALVLRTKAGANCTRGMDLLSSLLHVESVEKTERDFYIILDILQGFMGNDGEHFIQPLIGAGLDLEGSVRAALHRCLDKCASSVLELDVQPTTPQRLLLDPVTRGRRSLQLLAVITHKWDQYDMEFLQRNPDPELSTPKLLHALSQLLTAPLTSGVRPVPSGSGSPSGGSFRRSNGGLAASVVSSDDRNSRTELLCVADQNSLNRLYPNDFSATVPVLTMSRADRMVTIEKTASNPISLRADEGWPAAEWREGNPTIFYVEILIHTPINRVALVLAQAFSLETRQLDHSFSYESSGATHDSNFPAFGEGDAVGCGFVLSTRRVFFALNGVFLGFCGTVHDRCELLFPILQIENRDLVKISASYGAAPFRFDFRMLHPALTLEPGPSWHRVATAASQALFVIAVRSASVDSSTASSRITAACAEIICDQITQQALLLQRLHASAGGSDPLDINNAAAKMRQPVVVTAMMQGILGTLLATLCNVIKVVSRSGLAQMEDQISNRAFEAISALIDVPNTNIKILATGVLSVVLPHLLSVRSDDACRSLVGVLFALAKAQPQKDERIPFCPNWIACDSRCIAISNAQTASMLPEAQRSVVLGTVLPRTGCVSFTVRVTRENMTKGHSLKGGYFVGVAVANLTPLSPPSNSQSWKVQKPPVVWALHDTSPQLPHAVNPTVKANNFQRTFGSGDVITVVVNRDAQTVGFYRDDVFLKELYQDLPLNVDLAPFAQLYNDDASVTVAFGEMTPVITASTLLGASAVDVLRSMFTRPLFEHHLTSFLTAELAQDSWPSVTLAVFGSLPDPRCLTLRHPEGETRVVIRHIPNLRCKFFIGDNAFYEHVQNLRTPCQQTVRGKLDVTWGPSLAATSVAKCVEGLVLKLNMLVAPSVTTGAVHSLEFQGRADIVALERDSWDAMLAAKRMQTFHAVLELSKLQPAVLAAPGIPSGYVFSQPLSHQSLVFPARYGGRLATVPNGSPNAVAPFIGIAEPKIPATGKFSLRWQLIRGHHGQILGGGYYVGVCLASFHFRRKELNSTPPEVWALHDMDDAPWRLRHINNDRRLPTAAEPNCLLVSGDTVRLEIDRDEGTILAYRRPANAVDEIFVGHIFDNLPKHVDLCPFVHIYNVDASIVLLPSSPGLPPLRTTSNIPRHALSLLGERKCCDGCVSQHRETKLQGKDWFKCNECVDFNLCPLCIDNFVHAHHTFTKMDPKNLLYTKASPGKVAVGQPLIVSGSPLVYLRSVRCLVSEEKISNFVEARADDAFAMWGVVSAVNEHTFTVSVDFKASTLPVYVGIGEMSEIVNLSSEELRARCVAVSSSIIALCSESRVRRQFCEPSLQPHGYPPGSTISLSLSRETGFVTAHRNWIRIGTIPASPTLAGGRIVGFVLFGSAGGTASVIPDTANTIPVTVAEITCSNIIRVSDAAGVSRYCALSDCRVPIYPPVTPLRAGDAAFTVIENDVLPCKITARERDHFVVLIPRSQTSIRVPHAHLFAPAFSDCYAESSFFAARQRQVQLPEFSTSLADGYVITRMLMILAGLLEEPNLAGIILSQTQKFLPALQKLASVKIANDAPRAFMGEVRSAITATCGIVLSDQTAKTFIDPFVPTVPLFSSDTKSSSHAAQIRPGTIVTVTSGPNRGSFFRALGEARETSFQAEVFGAAAAEGQATHFIDSGACVIAKQARGMLWWQVPNGLPATMVEHAIRVSQPPSVTQPLPVAGLEGEWHGSLITTQNLTIAAHFSSSGGPTTAGMQCVGKATLPDGRVLEIEVTGVLSRYARGVQLVLKHAAVGPHMTNEELRAAMKAENLEWNADVTRDDVLRRLQQAHASTPKPRWVLTGAMDAHGLCIAGNWKHTDGLSGTFVFHCLRSVAFNAARAVGHIEPLMDCVDYPISRDVPSTSRDIVHRLVILLARHVLLVLLFRNVSLSRDIPIASYHAHPLLDDLIVLLADAHPQRLIRMISEAAAMIHDHRETAPWDCATLSSIITKSILAIPRIESELPSVFYDSLHAVVAGALRCGEDYRHIAIRNVKLLCDIGVDDNVRGSVLMGLCAWVTARASQMLGMGPTRRDVAAGVELLLDAEQAIAKELKLSALPVASLRTLTDLATCLERGQPLPAIVDAAMRAPATQQTVEVLCPFGQYADGELKVGKIMSSIKATGKGRFYFEITLPEKALLPFAVGWGTAAHTDIPSQHVGSDGHSFAFNGAQVVLKQSKEEYRVGLDLAPSSVVGCLLDLGERAAAWSVSGIVGPFWPIPLLSGSGADLELAAFVSTGSCSGMKIAFCAHQFQYPPDGYSDLAGRSSGVGIDSFNEQRSQLPCKPVAFYAQLSMCLSDSYTTTAGALPASGPNLALPPPEHLRRYPQLSHCSSLELLPHLGVIRVAESCMSTAKRFIDLDTDAVHGDLASAFLFLRQVATRPFRRKMTEIPACDKSAVPVNVTVRFYELSSPLPRTPDVALHHSVLSQLHKQVGSFSDKLMLQNPLFKVHLFITASGHAPQDLGGPYRQLWTLLGDEIMTHPDKCHPHSSFHRNPLFRFVNNSNRLTVVPDRAFSSPNDLALFHFTGRVMGHLARARIPLPLDLSPFLWKFLVEDTLTINDYFAHVDSVVEKSLEDGGFLLSEVAEDVIPDFSEALIQLEKTNSSEDVAMRRAAAENCLVHSLDKQLTALRNGIWAVLPKRVTRCLSWQDLERAVCGDPSPSMEQMRESLTVQLRPSREAFLWKLLEEMQGPERSKFLCFACGQRRLPLVKKVRVVENSESVQHLPRAQSCSALILVPQYTTYEVFRQKMLQAIDHQTEMELA
jgi:hypothetical protein